MLTLTIERKWFDMILLGEKKEEYREIKPFYDSRIMSELNGSTHTFISANAMKFFLSTHKVSIGQVKFRNGYTSTSPEMIAECTIRIGTGKKEWGADPDTEYYVLEIKKIVWNSITGKGGNIGSCKYE